MVVAISQYTQAHFLSVFPHYPAGRTTIIYPGSRFEGQPPGPRPAGLAQLNPGGFWLSVATIEPRKNFVRLVEAYRMLKQRGETTLPLVLAGGPGWLMERFRDALGNLEPGRDVILPGYVSDEELRWLYANCFTFVYPSLFEGFGMPVLEALGFGATVISSQSSSLPEVVGDAGLLIDPRDTASIAEAMARVSRGEVNRNALRAAAQAQAKRFSWARSASSLLDVYRQAMDAPRLFPPARTSL